MRPRNPAPLGEKFGLLTVMSEADDIVTGSGPKRAVLVECSCGTVKVVQLADIKSGNSTSCGCQGRAQARALGKSRLKHGQYGSPEYESWSGMLQRCTNPNLKAYKLYGGRGIRVCDRWLTFENFLHDMGKRPDGTSLDRFPDKDGNYEPGNCRWATRKEQGRNTNAVRLNEDLAERIRNDRRPDKVIAEELGVSRVAINHVKNGRTWKKEI